MSWYCDFAPGNPVHEDYHEREYGFPLVDETALFEILALEVFQPGLSWDIVLRKRPTTAAAFGGFDVDMVAAYGDADVARLLADPGIIRNRLKVAAVIENARRIRRLRESGGGFSLWLARHHPLNRAEWTKLFRETFKFMGPEVVGEFLMCIGYLPGAHRQSCPVYPRIARLDPPWMQVDQEIYDNKKNN